MTKQPQPSRQPQLSAQRQALAIAIETRRQHDEQLVAMQAALAAAETAVND